MENITITYVLNNVTTITYQTTKNRLRYSLNLVLRYVAKGVEISGLTIKTV